MDGFARVDRRLIVMASVLLLVAFGLALAQETRPSWAADQDRVHALVSARLGADKASELPTGIQQIWIEPLDRVDRCVTCHTTVEWGEELADAPHPARSHPHPKLMAAHPVERFGCTLCHGGQGSATTMEAAHGHVAHWEEPLLDSAKAETYGLTRSELMEYRCALCHQTLDEVPGMPLLNAARERAYDCIDCHRIPGVDGDAQLKAPDLTREGEKHPTKYTFPADWTGERTALAWQIAHMLDPRSTSPGSTMTNFKLKPKEAAGLALLVMSWRRNHLPTDWVPRKKRD